MITLKKVTILPQDNSIDSAISIRQDNAPAYGFDFTLDDNVNGNLALNYVNNGSSAESMSWDRTTGAIRVNNAYTLPTSDGTANYVMTTNGSGSVGWQGLGYSIATAPSWQYWNSYNQGDIVDYSGTKYLALQYSGAYWWYYPPNYPSYWMPFGGSQYGSSGDIQKNGGYIQGYNWGTPGYLYDDGYSNYSWQQISSLSLAGSSSDIQTNNGSGNLGSIQGYNGGTPGYLYNNGWGSYSWSNASGAWTTDGSSDLWSNGIGAWSPGSSYGGSYNIFGGYGAGAYTGYYGGSSVSSNVMLGFETGYYSGYGYNNTNSQNIFIGYQAGFQGGYAPYYSNISNNIALGSQAGYFLGGGGAWSETTSNNLLFGNYAGFYLSYGQSGTISNNLFLGNYAGYNLQNISNTLIIDGFNRSGSDATQALIYGTFANGSASGQQLTVNGQLNANAFGATYAIDATGVSNLNGRTLINGATDDTTSALQVNGIETLGNPSVGQWANYVQLNAYTSGGSIPQATFYASQSQTYISNVTINDPTIGTGVYSNNQGTSSAIETTASGSNTVLLSTPTYAINATGQILLNPMAQPTGTTAGQIYFDSTSSQPYYYNGSTWQAMGGGGGGWTESANTLFPTASSTDRVLIGGATDDATSALQVNGTVLVNNTIVSPSYGSTYGVQNLNLTGGVGSNDFTYGVGGSVIISGGLSPDRGGAPTPQITVPGQSNGPVIIQDYANIELNPSSGRVLIATTTDDGTSALQVDGIVNIGGQPLNTIASPIFQILGNNSNAIYETFGNIDTLGGQGSQFAFGATGAGNGAVGGNSFVFYDVTPSYAGSGLLRWYINKFGGFNINPTDNGSPALQVNGAVAISNLSVGGTNPVYWDLTTGVLYRDGSSLRYKTNVQPLTDDFSKILQVEPKSFNYISNNRADIGYIAEQFDSLGLNDLVGYDKQGRPDSIKYEKIPLYLTEIIKQQQSDINQLKLSAGLNTNGSLGNGTIYFKDISVNQITATTAKIETATIQKMQMVDQVTGDIYCTWIANGEWQKTKGECSPVAATTTTSSQQSVVTPTTPQQPVSTSTETTSTPAPAPEATSTPETATSTPEVSTSTPEISAPEATTSTPEVSVPTPQVDVNQLKQEVTAELKQELKPVIQAQVNSQVQSAENRVQNQIQNQIQDQVQNQVQQQLQDQQQTVSSTPSQPTVQPEQQPSAPASPESLPQAGANLLKAFGGFIKWLFISTWKGAVSMTKTVGHSTANLIDSVGIYFQAGSQHVSSGATNLTGSLLDSVKGLWEMIKLIFHIK